MKSVSGDSLVKSRSQSFLVLGALLTTGQVAVGVKKNAQTEEKVQTVMWKAGRTFQIKQATNNSFMLKTCACLTSCLKETVSCSPDSEKGEEQVQERSKRPDTLQTLICRLAFSLTAESQTGLSWQL